MNHANGWWWFIDIALTVLWSVEWVSQGSSMQLSFDASFFWPVNPSTCTCCWTFILSWFGVSTNMNQFIEGFFAQSDWGRQVELGLSSRLLHSFEEIFILCVANRAGKGSGLGLSKPYLRHLQGRPKPLEGLRHLGPYWTLASQGQVQGLNKDLKRT